MQLSVCVDAVFSKTPVEQAAAAVARSGIRAFEFWAWWNRDLDAIQRARGEHGLAVATFCARTESLVDPALLDRSLVGVRESLAKAKALDAGRLIVTTGQAIRDVPRTTQHLSIVKALKAFAPLAEDAGVDLVLEPLNTRVDHAGYFLEKSEEAFAIVDEVGSPRVKVLFDIYHQQITEGHLIATITRNIGKIGHFHAAGNPGRHELTTGEIAYGNVAAAIRAAGYVGYLGLEYWPTGDAEDGLRAVAGMLV